MEAAAFDLSVMHVLFECVKATYQVNQSINHTVCASKCINLKHHSPLANTDNMLPRRL